MEQLTEQERTFIVQALNQLNLTGQPADLRQALALIESILAKLETVDMQPVDPQAAVLAPTAAPPNNRTSPQTTPTPETPSQ